VSEEDRRVLAENLPGKPLAIVPNIHLMPAPDRPDDRIPGRMLFVGGFMHLPNVDAVHHFCADVLPRVHAEVPSATLLIVGSDPPPSVQSLAGGRVEVLGYVPDLSPVLRSAAVSVAPLRYGAGLKGKVGEAMSFALPVVTTTVGAEGFGIQSGTHAIVADNPTEFAAAVVRLLRDSTAARRVGEQGRALVERKLSERVVAQLIREMLQCAATIKPRRLPMSRQLRMASSVALERNLLWRFR
jgi:glycosyltransferase involved in cell wall biosynthesis